LTEIATNTRILSDIDKMNLKCYLDLVEKSKSLKYWRIRFFVCNSFSSK